MWKIPLSGLVVLELHEVKQAVEALRLPRSGTAGVQFASDGGIQGYDFYCKFTTEEVFLNN